MITEPSTTRQRADDRLGRGLSSSLYRPLAEGDVERIIREAMRILEKAGLLVYSKTARTALRAAGAEVDEATCAVKMPRGLVEEAIASNPSSITLCSCDGKTDIELAGGKVHYATGGTAIYVLDPDTGERRPSTVDDVILNARLVDVLENVDAFTINVFPNDVEKKDHIDVNRFFHSIDNTTKHVMGGIYSLKGCRRAIELAEMVAGSPEALRERPFVSFITLVISPLKIDDAYGEMACHVAAKGLPIVVPTEPICGTTAPITLAGNVLIHVAETLGGIAVVQSVRKGAPGICGSVGSITDLRTMDHVSGAVERAMINAAVSQVAQRLQLPLYSTAGTSDSKEADIQAGYESALSSLLVAMSGANYIHDIAGLMEADLTVSYEKLVVDNEILGMCQRVLRGIEVTDETLAADLIIERGPGSDYLAEDHTVRHMRSEFFMPRISNRDKRGASSAADAALARARAVVEKTRSSPAEHRIAADVRARIVEAFPEIRAV
ncbi:MAG: trimethylamine methyltransferase family protein [Planctomycetes bacterium]|nr:trimethylamine methyltransferase family protein [Planctomycetota bacterium]